MSEQRPDLNRFTTKTEAVESIIEDTWSHQVMLTVAAMEYAAPWGETALNEVLKQSTEIGTRNATPMQGTAPDEMTIGTDELIQILVREEGWEPFRPSAAGRGFTAELVYEQNLPLLADSVDGVSPRDLDLRWRHGLRNKDRELDIEGLYDEIDRPSVNTEE